MTGALHLYAIVDAAQDESLYALIQECPEQVCLFAGTLAHPLELVAPYLVRLAPDTRLAREWQRTGWGMNWGILLRSARNLEELRRHFRQFLQAMLPDGQIVLFRFYDPRVFRTYLPTLKGEDRVVWFEGIEEFRLETEYGAGTLYCELHDTREVARFG